MSLHLLLPFLMMISGWASAPAPTGQEVLQQMHQKYKGKFSPYFTFDQTAVVYHSPTDSTVQVWHEAIAFPGKLIIKFNDFAGGNGAIYAQDSQYVFKEHELQSRRRRVHELLVLAFDVYHQPIARTVAQLQEAGLDLSKAYETTWRGRPVFVVGKEAGQEGKSHFMVDKQHLWLLQTVRQDGARQSVVDLKGYQNVQGNWIATDLTFTQNGKPVMHEVYYNMRFPKTLPPSLFTVAGFEDASW